MKPEREGIIWALLTDDERAEMPTPESRQWYDDGKWNDDEEHGTAESMAYRPRPKPPKSWQDEFEEWAKGKNLLINGQGYEVGRICFNKQNGTIHGLSKDLGSGSGQKLTADWRNEIHEAEEYIEPYTQDTLPWPLVVRIPGRVDVAVSEAGKDTVALHHEPYTYRHLATFKTPSGEPCGIRKWRKKA